MRLTLCYRVVRSRGFFFGIHFFSYKRTLLGFNLPVGLGSQSRFWLGALGGVSEGLPRFSTTSPLRREALGHQLRQRAVNTGLILLRQHSPFLEPFWPMVWSILRYLKIRHFRGWRYRLGLPARGQRTHANASTTRRVRSTPLGYLRTQFWQARLWEPRKRPALTIRTRARSQSRRATKAERHKKGVVRTRDIKKKDVWK